MLELDESWFDVVLTMERNKIYHDLNQSLAEVLWRTLCIDMCLEYNTPAPDSYTKMFKLLLCAMVCCQPELNIRKRSAAKKKKATSLFGLLWTPPKRTIESKHFDCVRRVIPKLEALRVDTEDLCIPVTHEIAEYFAAGEELVFGPDGFWITILPAYQPFIESYIRAYRRRRLFSTRGGYLGLGFASLEASDTVWLVPGYGMPMILRPASPGADDQSFQFQGHAYIHGIMHGEATKGLVAEDLVDIVLV